MASPLGSIYSAIDSQKRRLIDALRNPRASVEQALGRANDDAREGNQLMSAAAQEVLQGGDFAGPANDRLTQAMTKMVEPGAIFIGKGAKVWDALRAQQAEKMASKGADPRVIWKETGTWMGPDGKWRQEISDHLAKSRDYQLTPAKGYEQARYNAMVNDSQALRDRANSMTPYSGMTKKQLEEQYATTGKGIVDAAVSGDMELAKRLSSERSGLTDLLSEMGNRKYGPASAYLKHGELGQAYPDVYKMHTRINPDALGAGTKAHYFEGSPYQGEQIVLGNKPTFSGDKSTMLHEMQHAIQKREGFARGGSPDLMRIAGEEVVDPRFIDGLKKWNKTLAAEGYPKDKLFQPNDIKMNDQEKLWDWIQQQGGWLETKRGQHAPEFDEAFPAGVSPIAIDADEAYRRLAGEAEARATQARMNLTPEQRIATFPADSYDVPVNELIVRFGNQEMINALRKKK